MRARLALALLLALAGTARGGDLRVQARWRVVGVAASTSQAAALPERVVRRALEGGAATIARELPGLSWEVAREVRRTRLDAAGVLLSDGDAIRNALERLAEDDPAVAAADVVFVFAPLPRDEYFGLARLRARPCGRPPVWYSVVNSAPGAQLAARLGLGSLLGRVAGRLVERPPVRDLQLRATVIHEFGHFLAPGTPDARAARRLDGIENGSEEPARHDLACIMWAPTPPSLLAKARAFPRVVGFCDRCRERVGCPRRRLRRLLAFH